MEPLDEAGLHKRLWWALGLLLIMGMFAWVVPASAEDAPRWRVTYYNSEDLMGVPALIREEPHINFDWGTGSPAPSVNADRFSGEWVIFQYFDGGTYHFYAQADDGVRVWVDDQLLIDEWHVHLPKTYVASKYLGPGYHSIRVTYFERTGLAFLKAWWTRGSAASGTGTWRGEYYANTSLSGTPFVRYDNAIDFNWGGASPWLDKIPADDFSVRWTRDVYFKEGNYIFYATADDGVRVSVDGIPVIDAWVAQSSTSYEGNIYLPAGTHQVRVEYFESTGEALCSVSWTGNNAPPPPSPITIVVDDQDDGFVWGGPPSSWYGRTTGYKGHLYWTWNTSDTTQNWAKWFPHVTAPGEYEVLVYIPERFSGTARARYVVALRGQQYSRTVNQSLFAGQWVSLGSFTFRGGADEYIYLGDATGEPYATRFVAFDAVKLVQGSAAAPPAFQPSCAIVPRLGFGRLWGGYAQIREALGCPLEMERTVWMAYQPFENGSMLWRSDLKGIYILYSNGTWQYQGDTWTSAEPEWDSTIVAPSGYYQPKRGFGKVWRTLPNVRATLGWATAEESGFWGSVETFERGVMFWSPTQGIYILYGNGRWERRY